MSSSPISVRPADGASAPASRLIAAAEALFGAGVICVFAALSTFVHWVTASSGWIFFALVTKPLVDLTWKWKFFELINQRVNPQAILAVLVAALNCVVALFVRRKPRYYYGVVALLGLATLSVLITPTSGGVEDLIRLFSGVSFFFTAGLALADKKKFDRFAVVFLAIVCVPLVLSLFQVVGLLPYEYWDWLDGQEVGRASGTYQHPLEIVFFLVYAVPLALYRWEQSEKGSRERIFLVAFFALATFGLGFTLHRTGWFAIGVELLIWFASRRQMKKIFLSTVALVVLGMFFTAWLSVFFEPFTEIVMGQADFASGNFLRGRGLQWFLFLDSFYASGPFHWAIGNGSSMMAVDPNTPTLLSPNEPHNDFIRILYTYGLAGLLLYSGLLVAFLREGLRFRGSVVPFQRRMGGILVCSLVGIVVLSLTTEPMLYPTGIWYLFALASIVMFQVSTRRELSLTGGSFVAAAPGGSGDNV